MNTIVEKRLEKPILLNSYPTIKDYKEHGGYTILGKYLGKSPEEIINIVKESGLKGRGGAGFPTAVKYEIASRENSEKKFIVCNADEGEPGTFKDRWILENNPHSIIEAMTVMAYSIKASTGFVYMRGEYPKQTEIFQKAVEEARSEGLIGKNILHSGFSFDIKVRRGAGSYVCGEETAMLESIEGKRAHPRFKPPFPGMKGLWGYPTVVNNVETFANIIPILRNGAKWFRRFGLEQSPGTKLYPVSGSVEKPSLVEANLGVDLQSLIELCGGIRDSLGFKCALVGGAAGGFFWENDLNKPLCYETLKRNGKLLGSGAIIVLSEKDNEYGFLKKTLEFFKNESCGKCTPCREGYPLLLEKYGRYMKGMEKASSLLQLAYTMKKTSLCALGQSAHLLLATFLKQK